MEGHVKVNFHGFETLCGDQAWIEQWPDGAACLNVEKKKEEEDLHWTLIGTNPAFRDLFPGIDLQESSVDALLDTMFEDHKILKELAQETMARGQSQRMILWSHIRRESIELTLIPGKSGQMVLILRSQPQISHGKQTCHLFDICWDAVVVIDQNHQVVQANPSFCRMLGYTEQELLQMYTWDWEALSSRAEIERNFPRVGQTNTFMATKHRCKDGRLIDVEFSASGAVIEGREVVICICRDVTQRKQGELALKQSEVKFRTFVEKAGDIIFTLNEEGELTYISPNIHSLMGYLPGEVLYQKLSVFLHPEDALSCWKFIQDAFRGNLDKDEAELRLLHVELGYRWHRLKGTINYLPSGERQFIGISRDVNDKRVHEEKLRYLSQHDPLTGLYNRSAFKSALETYEKEKAYPMTIVVCDLDNLKCTNDTHGHLAGDELLQNAAEIIKEAFSDYGIIARFGGDEFIALLKNTDEAMASKLEEQLRQDIELYNAGSDNGESIKLSVGFAVRTSEAESIDQIMKKADKAMYLEKKEKCVEQKRP